MTLELVSEGQAEFALHEPELRGPLDTKTVKEAAHIIDTSGVIELLAQWEEADRTHPGGAKPNLNSRGFLILLQTIVLEQQAPHLKKVAAALTRRMTPKAARILGIQPENTLTQKAAYDRVWRAKERIEKLIDPQPLIDRRRRLTKAELAASHALLRSDEEALVEKARRRTQFCNALLEATYDMMPDRCKNETVSLSIDATKMAVFARGIGVEKLEKMPPTGRVPIEPDAAYWGRGGAKSSDVQLVRGQSKPGKKQEKREFGVELEFAVLVSNDPYQSDLVPNITLGIEIHPPGFDPGGYARRVFDNIRERGHTLDHVVADRGYLPKARPDVFQNYLRNQGAKVVMDYNKDQLGLQADLGGAILVEGNLYSPGMPKVLIDAMKLDVDARLADAKDTNLTPQQRDDRATQRDEILRKRLASRENYRVRFKERPKGSKAIIMCPAVGPGAKVTCPLKELRAPVKPGPIKLLPVTPPPANAVGPLCTNANSVTIDMDKVGKYLQTYPFESPEWKAWYQGPRSTVESYNAFAKHEDSFRLGIASLRRLRGLTASFLLATVTVVAANVDKIRKFIRENMNRLVDARNGVASPRRGAGRSRKGSQVENIKNELMLSADRIIANGGDPPQRE